MIITPFEEGLRADCPAKLNLFLEILGKRPDGFHEVETVMVTVGLFDTLVFKEEQTEHVRLRCFEAGRRSPADQSSELEEPIPADARNLVVRAANLLKDRTGTTRGVSIDLHKRIPAAAGLAGGSSDAAATLASLNRLWDLRLSRTDLQAFAAELGSDIPFFLADRPVAICRGRGELVTPIEPAFRSWTVIVRPPVGLSTAEVFRNCRPANNPVSDVKLLEGLKRGKTEIVAQNLHNSLQKPAAQLCPLLKQLAQAFEFVTPAAHQMSGSGTAWFGLCRNRKEARQAAGRLNALGVGRVYVAQTCPDPI
jgi:4-diphosphocytidyl-2-C-methyl-D-erythritol kinase